MVNEISEENLEQMVRGATALARKVMPNSNEALGKIASTLIKQALELEDWDLYNTLMEFAPKTS